MSTQDSIRKELCVAVSTAIAMRSAIHNGISTRMSTGIHMSIIWLREITKPPAEHVNWGSRSLCASFYSYQLAQEPLLRPNIHKIVDIRACQLCP